LILGISSEENRLACYVDDFSIADGSSESWVCILGRNIRKVNDDDDVVPKLTEAPFPKLSD